MPTFAETYNRYQQLAFGTPAKATGATGRTADTVGLEQKLILLRQLYDAIDTAQRTGDTAALKVYQEQMEAYNNAAQQRARLLQTITETQGRLSVEQMRTAAADVRNIRDNYSRLLAGNQSRAEAMRRQVESSIAARDPNLIRDDPAAYRESVLRAVVAMLDPSDPASAVVLDYYASSPGWGGEGAVKAAASAAGRPDLLNQARAARGTQARQMEELAGLEAQVGSGKVDAGAATAVLQQPPPGMPTLAAAREEADSPERRERVATLEAQVDALERQIGGVVQAEATDAKLGGLTREQAQAVLQDPRFRAWAESRGYKLGEMRDTGYAISPGDIAALRGATREFSTGRPNPLRGGSRPGETVTTQVRSTAPATAPQFTGVRLSEDETAIVDGYLTYPDGSVERVNLATGEATPLRDASGRWLGTPSDADAYKRDVAANGLETLTHTETGAALSRAEILARRNNAGLPLEAVGFSDTPPAGTDTYADTPGRVLPPRLGDDPRLTRRVLLSDGTTVAVLRRDGPTSDWRRDPAEDIPYGYRGILRRPEQEQVVGDISLRRPSADRYETPPRPVVDEVFMGEVGGSAAGRAAGLRGPGAGAPDISPANYLSGEAVTAGLEGRIERREDTRDRVAGGMGEAVRRARAAATPAAPAPAPQDARQRPQKAREGASEHETETMPMQRPPAAGGPPTASRERRRPGDLIRALAARAKAPAPPPPPAPAPAAAATPPRPRVPQLPPSSAPPRPPGAAAPTPGATAPLAQAPQVAPVQALPPAGAAAPRGGQAALTGPTTPARARDRSPGMPPVEDEYSRVGEESLLSMAMALPPLSAPPAPPPATPGYATGTGLAQQPAPSGAVTLPWRMRSPQQTSRTGSVTAKALRSLVKGS